MSPAMEEGFLITGPPGKSQSTSFVTPTCDFRHKELAPLQYWAREEKLYQDPRLVELLKVFV